MNLNSTISNCGGFNDTNLYIRNVQTFAINLWYYKEKPYIEHRITVSITIRNNRFDISDGGVCVDYAVMCVFVLVIHYNLLPLL